MSLALPPTPRTRFAPAPTGRLHLGHLANAIYVWGLARRVGGLVILRIEDHDRQRCRPEYEAALLDDLDRLGLVPDEPSTDDLRSGRPSAYRQSDLGPMYLAALSTLEGLGLAYGCDCSRTTFTAWREEHGVPWAGAGCPGGCRERALARPRPGADPGGIGIRVALGDGEESWDDILLGPTTAPVAPGGDVLIRDRNGNWTYALCVVVDDISHGINLVVRGEDLVDATPAQIRLRQALDRSDVPGFAHHPLVRRADGTKLSKSDGSTSLGERLDAGASPEELTAEAAAASGLLHGAGSLSFDGALGLLA